MKINSVQFGDHGIIYYIGAEISGWIVDNIERVEVNGEHAYVGRYVVTLVKNDSAEIHTVDGPENMAIVGRLSE